MSEAMDSGWFDFQFADLSRGRPVAASDVNLTRSGSEQIYPGSHELRPLALFPVEHALVPEGTVVVASLQKAGEHRDLEEASSPQRTVELLSVLAFELLRQARQAREELASIGHPIQ